MLQVYFNVDDTEKEHIFSDDVQFLTQGNVWLGGSPDTLASTKGYIGKNFQGGIAEVRERLSHYYMCIVSMLIIWNALFAHVEKVAYGLRLNLRLGQCVVTERMTLYQPSFRPTQLSDAEDLVTCGVLATQNGGCVVLSTLTYLGQ